MFHLLNTVNFQVFWKMLLHSNFTRMHGFKSGSELCSFLKGGTSRRVIMYVWIYITLPGDLLNVSLKKTIAKLIDDKNLGVPLLHDSLRAMVVVLVFAMTCPCPRPCHQCPPFFQAETTQNLLLFSLSFFLSEEL